MKRNNSGPMMRTTSTILLIIAAFLTLFVIGIVLLAIAGSETALFVAGWGILFFGIPILVIVLTCLFVGLSLRSKSKTPDPTSERRQRSPLLGQAALTFGVLLLGYTFLQCVDAMKGATLEHLWFFFVLFFFNLKLPFAIGAIVFGLTQIKKYTPAEI